MTTHFVLYNVHYTYRFVYHRNCTLYIAYCISLQLYTVHRVLYIITIIHCTMYTVQGYRYIDRDSLRITRQYFPLLLEYIHIFTYVQCTLFNVQYTSYSLYCTLYNVHCTMYTVQIHFKKSDLNPPYCTMCSVNCILNYSVLQCTYRYI